MATALLSTPLAARTTRRSTRGRAAVAPRASLEVVHAAQARGGGSLAVRSADGCCVAAYLQEVAQLASDNRPLLLLGLGLPVLGYVAFNIGLPALRQLQGMVEEAPAKGKAKLRSVAALTGLAAALAASNDAAQAAQVRIGRGWRLGGRRRCPEAISAARRSPCRGGRRGRGAADARALGQHIATHLVCRTGVWYDEARQRN